MNASNPAPRSPDSRRQADDADRRRAGRLQVEDILCRDEIGDFGRVLDLSATGMRVLRNGAIKRIQEGSLMMLTVVHQQCQVLVNVRIRWVVPLGRKKALIGLEFVLLPDHAHEQLRRISRVAKVSTTFVNRRVD